MNALHAAIAASAYNHFGPKSGKAATPSNVSRLAKRNELRMMVLEYQRAVESNEIDLPLHDVAQISEAFLAI